MLMARQDSKDKYKLSAVDSIERLPLSEQVYLTLKTAILTGELMPQEKLNEVKIAEQLQVSATPVREAFRKLAKDNLVVIVPWKLSLIHICHIYYIIILSTVTYYIEKNSFRLDLRTKNI